LSEDHSVVSENEDLMFGSSRPWWLRHRWLRCLNYLALVTADEEYSKWRRSRVLRRKYLKMLDKLNKDYSPEKFSIKKL
jgi:hypothetical protein